MSQKEDFLDFVGLYHSDDLFHYSFELNEIYWWWMLTVFFIFTIAFGFFIGGLIEK